MIAIGFQEVAAAGTASRGYNRNINGFRGFCVLLVFVYHVYNSGLPPHASENLGRAVAYLISSFGSGVELFFMISGYVITGSIRRHAKLRAFLLDRVLRIYPAWLAVYLALSIGGLLTGLRIFAGVSGLKLGIIFAANLVFLPSILPIPAIHPASWSITYEWVFYLVAALLARFRRHADSLFGLIFCCSVVGLLLLAFPRALCFLPGVLVARHEHYLRSRMGLFRIHALGLLVFLLLWRWALPNTTFDGFGILRPNGVRLMACLLALLAGTYFFSGVVTAATGASALLRSGPLQALGNVSYSLYLWHPIVMFGVKPIVKRAILAPYGPVVATLSFAVMSFAISVVIARLSYVWIEGRITRALRRKLERRIEPLVTVASASAAPYVSQVSGK